MNWLDDPWETAIAVGSGVVFALLVMAAMIVFSGPHDPFAGDTTTTTTTLPRDGATTTTTRPGATTEPVPPGTEPVDFADDVAPKQHDTIEGQPGPYLTDVRFGAHPGFARIVFDFTGHGSPQYHVRYEEGPFVTDGEGADVDIDGEAFLVVSITPGTTFDVEEGAPTYHGEHRLRPRLDPIVEMVLTGDFEANLTWVVGLSEMKGFRVFVLDAPLRLVVDIASE